MIQKPVVYRLTPVKAPTIQHMLTTILPAQGLMMTVTEYGDLVQPAVVNLWLDTITRPNGRNQSASLKLQLRTPNGQSHGIDLDLTARPVCLIQVGPGYVQFVKQRHDGPSWGPEESPKHCTTLLWLYPVPPAAPTDDRRASTENADAA